LKLFLLTVKWKSTIKDVILVHGKRWWKDYINILNDTTWRMISSGTKWATAVFVSENCQMFWQSDK
jgi:hypothetical protein